MKYFTCLRVGKNKWILMVIFLMAVLTGCIAFYDKPGKSNSDFERDKKYCEGVAEKVYVRNGTRVCDEVDRCLISKGWKKGW